MLLDRLPARRPSADDQLTALARLRAFAAGGAGAGGDPQGGAEPAETPGPAVRLDPGRRGLLAIALVGVLAAVVAGVLYLRARPQPVAAPDRVAAGTPLGRPSPTPEAVLVVDVAGKVRRPGIVSLPAGSRVADALRAAGGPLPGVDTGLLNLARRLVDGEQVVVGMPAPVGADATSAGGGAGGLVDLNTATADQLETLPGVGPVLAQRIVDWRGAHGGFRSVDQLRDVSGIGAAKYADLKGRVTV